MPSPVTHLDGRAPSHTLDLTAIAESEFPVLVTGETGSGKERTAREVHTRSPRRRKGPLVVLNCGALEPGTARSALFGHTRGAFTGASAARRGAIREADGGTLFLDEVAELSAGMQSALLRSLESGVVQPVGSDRSVRSDFRLVAATHKSLLEEVSAGRFRQDLYYRIAVLLVRVPPLRERTEEFESIVRQVLRDLNAVDISPRALKRLREHTWPGNIRELRNVLARGAVRAGRRWIGAADLVFDPPVRSTTETPPVTATPYRPMMDRRERMQTRVQAALVETCGNRTEAARLLGISRSTLYSYL